MFDCPYCHAPFATYSGLLNHKRDGHPAMPSPELIPEDNPELEWIEGEKGYLADAEAAEQFDGEDA